MRFIKYDSRKILVDSDFQNFNKYKELNKESQYIWKEMNLADTICVC